MQSCRLLKQVLHIVPTGLSRISDFTASCLTIVMRCAIDDKDENKEFVMPTVLNLFYKVKLLSLVFNHVSSDSDVCGSGGVAPRIHNLGTRLMWVVSLTPRLFLSRDKIPGNHWIGGWMDTSAGLDVVVKRKIVCEIWGFHGSEDNDADLLGFGAV
jgi:hypothetical protein